jgi:hypothetical protein
LSIGASMAISGITSQLASPKIPSAQVDRLNLQSDPKAFRKTALGSTAFPLDVRYQEWNGPDQDISDLIVTCAGHKVESFDEIWINDELAWTSAGGAVGKFVGYFFADWIREGGPGQGFGLPGGRWTADQHRLTGCAYGHFRFKTTGIGKKATSPFSGGVPSRITVIGKGGMMYDPRRDSTIPGGSGPMRADDQSTWRYFADDGTELGSNLPLQILRVMKGWRIANPTTGAMKLSVGAGVPTKRLHLQSFMTAANLADERVNKTTGGTEPRFSGAITCSEGDEYQQVLDALCAACNGRIVEIGGKLGLVIAHNDLAAAATDPGLNDDDVIGDFIWNPDPALDQCPNVVSGSFTDPSSNSLYQQIPYPEARIPSVDGIDRIFPLDLTAVESSTQAERISSQVLQRKQYDRTFTATFDIRAWQYGQGDVLPLTYAPLSFVRQLCRVVDQEYTQDGRCAMTLRIEHPAIYAWDGGNGALVQAAAPNVYDSRNSAIIQGINEASETAAWSKVLEDDPVNHPRPADGATVGAPDGTMVGNKAAEAVAQAIDDFEHVQQDVQGLITTYGQTVAAATSAEAARLSALDSKGFADVANDNAQAAARSSSLATRGTSFTQNPNYSDWPDGQFLPTLWGPWSVENYPTVVSRTTGVDGYPNAVRMTLAANQNGGIVQLVNRPFGAYVIELTIRASNVSGAGVFVAVIKADNSAFDNGSADKPLSLLNKPDTSKWPGQPDGNSGGYLRTFSWFFATPVNGDIAKLVFYAMGNWENFGAPRNAKTFDVHAFRVRAATEAEIAQHDPIDGLEAKASHTEVVTVATSKADGALVQARSEYNAGFNGVGAQIGTAIFAAAGPNGIVGQKIDAVVAGTGGNIVPNTALVTSDGWVGVNGAGAADQFGLNGAGPGWQIYGENNLHIHHAADQGGGSYADWQAFNIPAEPNQFHQLSCLVAQHRCPTQIYVQRLDTAGNHIDYLLAWNYDIGGGQNGGNNIAGWNAPYLNFMAFGPVNILLRKMGSNVGADSWAWFCRPQICRVPSGDSPRVPYSPSANQATSRIVQASLADFAGKLASYLTLQTIAGSSNAKVSLVSTTSYSRIIFEADQFLFRGAAIFDGEVTLGKLARYDMIRRGYDQDYPEWRNSGLGVANIHPYFGIFIGGCDCQNGPSNLTVVVNRSRVRGIQTSATPGGMEYDGAVRIRVGYPNGEYVERALASYDDRVMSFYIPPGKGGGTVYVQAVAYNGATDFVTYEGAAGYVQHRSVDWAISELDVDAAWSAF